MNGTLFDYDAPDYSSPTFPPPRDFQTSAHAELRAGRAAGHRAQLIMAPTGSGKTYLGLNICQQALMRNKRAIFVCDRTTLIDQTSADADRYGLKAHGVIQSNHWRYRPDLPFQIASVQTLARREWPQADVIVIDEAHTQMRAWTEHAKTTNATVVGLSATPFSAGLGKIFTNLINAATMHSLTELGVLVPMRPYSCTKPNMRGAETMGGEWTDKAAEERGMEIVGDVVVEWVKYAENRKTIVFGATIAHCEELCRQFNDAGIMAATFTSDTGGDERKALLTEFRKHEPDLRVLISVEALAKGFDVPDVGCVVDARPLRKSLSTAIQMWGRGARSSPDTGKTDFILLDHSGNITRFMEDFTEIFYNGLDSLDAGIKLDKVVRVDADEKELKGCPACGFKPFFKRCISCGHEHQAVSAVETIPGEMQPVMLGKRQIADNHRNLWEQVCSYAKQHSAPDKQYGRSWHLYRDITGKEPPKTWSLATTPAVEVSAAVSGKIRSMTIAFAKRAAR